MSDIGMRAYDEWTRSAERYAAYIAEMSKQPKDKQNTEELVKRYVEFLRSEGTKFAGQIAEAGLAYYTRVIESEIKTANKFFELVLDIPRDSNSTVPPAPAASSLLFHGASGTVATNAFVVTNNRDAPVDVGFAITELAGESGDLITEPEVNFTPESCQLGPNAQQVVRCAILLSDQYRAKEDYRGQIQVVGFPEMLLRVSVRVNEA